MEHSGCTLPFNTVPNLAGYGEENLKFTKDDIPAVAAAIGYIAPIPIPGLTIYAYAAGVGIKKLLNLKNLILAGRK